MNERMDEITDARAKVLAEIEAMLVAALAKADAIGEVLPGAKIDDALACVRAVRARDRPAGCGSAASS